MRGLRPRAARRARAPAPRRARSTARAPPPAGNAARGRSAVDGSVRRGIGQAIRQRRGEAGAVLARHHRDVVAEQAVQLDAAGMVRAHDRRAAGQRLDRDGGQRLEQRRQHEHVGGAVVVGDNLVVDEPGEADVRRDAERRRLRLELGAQRAGAADHQLGVGVGAQHRRHRVQQVTLAGQRMQPLHVDQHVPPRQAETLPQRGARRLVDRREALDHRRIGDAQARPRQPELERLVVQAAAVERDRRRAAVHRGEQVDDALRPVVPDLGAVEREHGRDPAPARQPGHHLGEEPVAVQVHQGRPREQRLRFPGDAARRRQRREAAAP